MDPEVQLVNQESERPRVPADEALYLSILGSIRYLMLCTRPDLAYPVRALCKFTAHPTEMHMNACKRLLRYISKTKNLGLHYGPFDYNTSPIPVGFSDADWAGDQSTRRSTGAYVCTISTNQPNTPHTAISSSSKQQSSVALSSNEAEYMALTQACKEALWVKRFIAEIEGMSGHKKEKPVKAIYRHAALRRDLARRQDQC